MLVAVVDDVVVFHGLFIDVDIDIENEKDDERGVAGGATAVRRIVAFAARVLMVTVVGAAGDDPVERGGEPPPSKMDFEGERRGRRRRGLLLMFPPLLHPPTPIALRRRGRAARSIRSIVRLKNGYQVCCVCCRFCGEMMVWMEDGWGGEEVARVLPPPRKTPIILIPL